MDTVEQIKEYKKAKSLVVKYKLFEALVELEKLEKGEREVSVNGESEEIKDHCLKEISKVKIKKVADDTFEGKKEAV